MSVKNQATATANKVNTGKSSKAKNKAADLATTAPAETVATDLQPAPHIAPVPEVLNQQELEDGSAAPAQPADANAAPAETAIQPTTETGAKLTIAENTDPMVAAIAANLANLTTMETPEVIGKGVTYKQLIHELKRRNITVASLADETLQNFAIEGRYWQLEIYCMVINKILGLHITPEIISKQAKKRFFTITCTPAQAAEIYGAVWFYVNLYLWYGTQVMQNFANAHNFVMPAAEVRGKKSKIFRQAK